MSSIKNEEQMEFAVVGDGAVGKSAISLVVITCQFSKEYDATIQNAYRWLTNLDGKNVYVEITDTAGQEEFITLEDQYMRQNEGFLLVYDVTREGTLPALKRFVEKIKMVKNVSSFPAVLVGNKIDLKDQRKISTQQGKEFAKTFVFDCPHFETSAATAENCETALHALIREIRKARKAKEDINSLVATESRSRKNSKGIFRSSTSEENSKEDIDFVKRMK